MGFYFFTMRALPQNSSAPHSTPLLGKATLASTWARLAPYLWRWRGRVLVALFCLMAAKIANVGVPWALKHIVDELSIPASGAAALLVVPLAWLLAYGALRLSTTLFTELREFVFYPVVARIARQVSLEVFQHLFSLSLSFHLARQTGGVSRDIERGSRAIQSLLSYIVYNIVPTLIEMALVLVLLATQMDAWFVGITLSALLAYIVFTVMITEWRTGFRRTMNEQESRASTKAVDALLNYETVKYFSNEQFEHSRYDDNLHRYESAAVRSQTSLSVLNLGQSSIIAVAVTLLMWRATLGVAAGTMTLGDLVLVNALMIQLYIPLNFLGVIYREIKQSMIDLEKMFALLSEHREVADAPNAPSLHIKGGHVQFRDVCFSYDPDREILHRISFDIPPGKTVAVVGASGSGKSTLARLLFRFYDVTSGEIRIDGQEIRAVTQRSLRQSLGIVPQDTVLFNDTIAYNIAYGRPEADMAEIEAAAQSAHIHALIASMPRGYQTLVGERGLKLSGGEKQRVAIARTLLKNPSILIFDEATSALDSANERAIQAELQSVATNKTTLVIAHRLSTIVDACQILVMDAGHIIERGTHAELLALRGRYADMWQMQQSSAETSRDNSHGNQMA